MADELSDKVLAWLRQGGYPLEYSVAMAMRRAGFHAAQGLHYADRTTGKSREIDVVATRLRDPASRVSIKVVVECKAANENPWVVLSTIGRPEDWTPLCRPRSMFSTSELLHYYIRLRRPYGYSVIEALRKHDREDRAVNAMNQVVSSAIGVLSQDGYVYILPVVVTAAPLYKLHVSESGQEALEEIGWQRVRWHGAQAMPEPTIVDVVTRDAFGAYLDEVEAEFEDLGRGLDELAGP